MFLSNDLVLVLFRKMLKVAVGRQCVPRQGVP